MKSDKTTADVIEIYLLQVRNKLRGLSTTQASEIIAELRSHILDSVSATNEVITDAAKREALHRLGPPETLAAMYLTENLMAKAETSRSPWLVMRTLFRLAIKSVWALAAFLLSFFGYGSATAFLVCAIAKPFYPDHVGFWWDTQSHMPTGLGFIWPAPSDRELLGWWIIPLCLVISPVLFVVTTRFARWNIRQIRRSRRSPFHPQGTLASTQSAS
jgi:hypothetical protein